MWSYGTAGSIRHGGMAALGILVLWNKYLICIRTSKNRLFQWRSKTLLYVVLRLKMIRDLKCRELWFAVKWQPGDEMGPKGGLEDGAVNYLPTCVVCPAQNLPEPITGS